MEIGYAPHQPLAASWPARPSALKQGDSHRAWEQALEYYLSADQLGFDFVTTTEHHYNASIDPNPAMTGAVLSQQLRRARLHVGLSVPMLNPVRVAEEIALLDVMANGRLSVAMLSDTPNDAMTYFNINPVESGACFQEAVELVKACWDEPEPFAWEGRFHRFRTIAVSPSAVTPGGPRMIMSGSNQAAIDFVVRHRADLALSGTGVVDTAQRVQMFHVSAQLTGWHADRSNVLYRNMCYVASTDEQALADVSGHGYGSVDLTGTFRPPVFCGSPVTVIEQLREFHRAGVGKVDLAFSGLGLPRDLARKSMELFAAEVLPAVHEFADDTVRI
jgi:alkanesulfonate monooxygenase SsuD/methylene tetrahydromethanopterin reductase-like flavin-dependent oxidoreductase (luciferase family)